MFSFSEDNMEYIKGYLEDYLEDYEQKGFVLLEDPLSSFYEALCTGFHWRDVNPHFQHIPSNNFLG